MVHHKVLLCKNTFYKDPNNGVINYKLIFSWASQVVLVVKNLPTNAGDAREEGSVPGSGRCPGEEMASHSSILTWKIPWTEEPGGLQSMGLQRVRYDSIAQQQKI